MNTDTPHAQHLELRVREVGQLFNSMDPTPFLNKDLDREAEAFIETWALGLPPDSRLHLTIHVEHLPAEGDPTVLMTDADGEVQPAVGRQPQRPGFDKRLGLPIKVLVEKGCRVHRVEQLADLTHAQLEVLRVRRVGVHAAWAHQHFIYFAKCFFRQHAVFCCMGNY